MQRSSEDIELYRDFCRRVDVPLFANDYWLDAVCPGEWGVFLVRKGDRVVAALPYHEVHRFGLRFMLQPVFTQFLGPQVDYSGIKEDEYSRRSFFRECVENILDMIDKKNFAYCQIAMHRSVTDWLPFYWRGFRSSLRYTYVIEDISSYEKVAGAYHASKRTHLNRAAKNGLTPYYDMTLEDFYQFHKKYIEDRGGHLSYHFPVLSEIYRIMSDKKQCRIIAVRGENGELQSAVFVVWDSRCAYQLTSCTDSRYRSTGGSTLVVDEAVRFCSEKVRCYDFEGSMIHNVEQSYSKYGSSQKPYIYLERYSSLAMEFLLRASGKVK